MYDINKLEKDWVKYRNKKVLPLFGLGVVVFVFSIGIYKFYSQKILTYISTNRYTTDTNSTKLNSSINLSQNSTTSSKVITIHNKTFSGKDGNIGQMGSSSHLSKDTINKEHKIKKIKIVITARKKSGNIAIDVENRFQSSPNKHDSIFLAKYYYDRGDYKKAEKWAYETNKLDNNIEDSWLIFAKAKAKQGRRVDAIKILEAYYKKSGSIKAKNLIDSLRLGKQTSK